MAKNESSQRQDSSTTNTDARQFDIFEQALTGSAMSMGSSNFDIMGSSNEISQYLSRLSAEIDQDIDNSAELDYRFDQEIDASQNLGDGAIMAGGNVNYTDGGAIESVENVATFAIDAATGGLVSNLSAIEKFGSMAFELVSDNQEAYLSSFNDLLGGVKESTSRAFDSVESILAESQTSGEQDVQKSIIYVGGAVAVALGIGAILR